MSMERISVIGLGYVGLPLAAHFAKKIKVTAFDINERRVSELRAFRDTTGEIDPGMLKSENLEITGDESELKKSMFHIVAVPTPIDRHKMPDLSALDGASQTVGRNLIRGATVVYESTVYPGVTEEFCRPILEEVSGLECDRDFKIGYSPERINPGDKEHTVDRITKIVAGMDESTTKAIAAVYGLIVEAGIYQAPSIMVAEAAKVIENAQRDINIAFMNELSLVFSRLGVDTNEVLKAAKTKWNFLDFTPGLVGGHCIGVDPYYLTFCAEYVGYHPQVILAGRRINDTMGKYVAENAVKLLIKAGRQVNCSKALILGATFKKNVPDIRNSKVFDIADELEDYGIEVLLADPHVNPKEVREEYGRDMVPVKEVESVDAVIVAVDHDEFSAMSVSDIKRLFNHGRNVLVDVKGVFSKPEVESYGITYWSL